MILTITDPEAQRLAQEIADATGESVNSAVVRSLRERRERIPTPQPRASVEELLAIADEIAAGVRRPYVDHDELLFDEHGLPK